MSTLGSFWRRRNPLIQVATIGITSFVIFSSLPSTWIAALNNKLNPREEALFLWGFIFILWCVSQPSTRNALYGILKSIINPTVIVVLSAMTMYVSVVVLVLSQIGLWQLNLLKETVFWSIGTALISLVNYDEIAKDERYFRKKLLDSVKLIVLIEFIVNFYTFSLGIEMFLVPLLFLLGGIGALAERNPDQQGVKKATDSLLVIFSVTVLLHASTNVLCDHNSLVTLENLREVILPSALTVTYLPFLYGWALLVTYDELFRHIDIILKRNKTLAKFTKWQILICCRANLRRLVKFKNENMRKIGRLKQKDDVKTLTRDFKHVCP